MSDHAKEQENGKGLACRRCGCRHFRVVYTRPGSHRRLIRRRECRHCGTRMTTWEAAIADLPAENNRT